MAQTDKQFAQLLEIIANSKLFSELEEQTLISDDSFFASINTGLDDAKKIKLPLLRGYNGDWNASTNTPTLINGTGVAGTVHRVSTQGTRDLGNGSLTYGVDEIIYYNSAKWVKLTQSQISDIEGLQTAINGTVKTTGTQDIAGEKTFTNDTFFDSNIKVTGAFLDTSNSSGITGQVLTSTETGTAWINQDTIISSVAKLVEIDVKNTSGTTIVKGTPVYQTGTVGDTSVLQIAPADSLISSGNQPAIGLLAQELNNNGVGTVVISGALTNIITNTIDGVSSSVGDKIYLKSGGGLTLTKPTGSENGIQNIGLIGRVSPTGKGVIIVSSILRTNDVPNLPEGRIWVGDGNTLVSESIFIDELNNRVGIGDGMVAPAKTLDVDGDAGFAGDVTISKSAAPKITFHDLLNVTTAGISFDGDVESIHISTDLNLSTGKLYLSGEGRIIGVDLVINPTDAASKGYVDNLDTENVKKTGVQSIAGVKTFTDNVRISGNLATLEFYDDSELVLASMKLDPYADRFEFDKAIYSAQDIRAIGSIRGSSISASTSYTFATLPVGSIGLIAHITDASTISYRAVAVGGGSSFALVVFDGTNWIYH